MGSRTRAEAAAGAEAATGAPDMRQAACDALALLDALDPGGAWDAASADELIAALEAVAKGGPPPAAGAPRLNAYGEEMVAMTVRYTVAVPAETAAGYRAAANAGADDDELHRHVRLLDETGEAEISGIVWSVPGARDWPGDEP